MLARLHLSGSPASRSGFATARVLSAVAWDRATMQFPENKDWVLV
jgi:hypothetical protein